jgi:hypothetical protein
MEILNYSLIALITALGLICGAVIGYFAKEELKPGKNYFVWLQKILFTLAIVLLMYANRTNVHYMWAGGLIIFIYLYYYEKMRHAITYAFLAFVFFLASLTGMFLPVSASIFLYSFPTGSLIYKNKRDIAVCIISFMIIALILFFLNQKF